MKLKDNYVLRQVAGNWVVLPVGERVADLRGMITLNESGALLWKILEHGADIEMMADTLMMEYEVSREKALNDAKAFCEKARCGGFLVE